MKIRKKILSNMLKKVKMVVNKDMLLSDLLYASEEETKIKLNAVGMGY